MEWVAQLLWKSYDFAFGCHHRNLSRVFTIERRTYRVCCSCGAKFTYSLENMSVEQSIQKHNQEGRLNRPGRTQFVESARQQGLVLRFRRV